MSTVIFAGSKSYDNELLRFRQLILDYTFDLAPSKGKTLHEKKCNNLTIGELINYLVGQLNESDILVSSTSATFQGKESKYRFKADSVFGKITEETLNNYLGFKQALLTKINLVRGKMGRRNISGNLQYLKCLLMILGNFASQHNHLALNKDFCSRDFSDMVSLWKSNDFCRDTRYLAFSLTACLPDKCNNGLLRSRRKRNRERHDRQHCH